MTNLSMFDSGLEIFFNLVPFCFVLQNQLLCGLHVIREFCLCEPLTQRSQSVTN